MNNKLIIQRLNIVRHVFQLERHEDKILFNFKVKQKDKPNIIKSYVLDRFDSAKVDSLLSLLTFKTYRFSIYDMVITHIKDDLFNVKFDKQTMKAKINELKRRSIREMVTGSITKAHKGRRLPTYVVK